MTQDCQRPVINSFLTAARAAAVFLCFGSQAVAEDVTVTTPDDGVTLTGRVVSYDGTHLQLETAYGLLTLVYAQTTCEGAACPDPNIFVPQVRMSGAARIGDVMMPALVEAYGRGLGLSAVIEPVEDDLLTIDLVSEEEEVKATFTLRQSSTDEGFADLIALEADIVLAMREVRQQEAQLASQIGLGDITDPNQARILGFDGLTPVVNPGLDLQSISLADIAQAFRGEVTNWAEIGGPDLPIALHFGPSSGGSWQFFADHVVRLGDGMLAESVVRHATTADLIAAVVANPGSLTVLPYGETGNTQPLALRDSCGYTASAQPLTLKTQDYSLTQPLFLYLPDRRQPQIIQDFLAWMRGPEAQLVVRRAGFVDQGAVPISLDAQGQRFANAIAKAGSGITLGDLQEMVDLLGPLTRLSTSFRFRAGSADLDAASWSNLLALGQAIRDGRFTGQTLYLVGFGNGPALQDGSASGSMGRAEAVQEALIAALGALPEAITLEVAAFGEALPMGCNDTPWGQHRNRRVELWVDQR